MGKFFQLRSDITYWLDEVDERSLHSPFYYDLYTKVINTNEAVVDENKLEQLRSKLLTTDLMIDVDDHGSGAVLPNGKRNVRDIARTSLSPAKFSSLYTRLISHFKIKTIVELGTSLGINASYLASVPGTSVTTFEGSRAIASVAKSTIEFAALSNVTIIEGPSQITLPDYVGRAPKLDFVFMDAHHEYKPTLQYFSLLLTRLHAGSIMLIDDIHYSAGMEAAWKELKAHPLVYGSIDLYRVGILLFDPSLNKQHVVLQF